MIEDAIQISKLFIPLIAFLGLYIAWQQYVANKTKIRLELYDKRFNIYNAIVTVIGEILSSDEKINEEQYKKFFVACNEAQFLLPDDVYACLSKPRELVGIIKVKKRSLYRLDKKDDEGLSKVKEALCNELMEYESELEDLEPSITYSFSRVLKFEKF